MGGRTENEAVRKGGHFSGTEIFITFCREWPEAVRKYKSHLQTGSYDQPKPKLFSEQEVFAYTNSVYDWEEAVDSIEYIEKSKIPGLLVYVNW